MKLTAAAGLLAMAVSAQDIQSYYFKPGRVRVLVLSGRNGHDWRTSSLFLKKVLEDTGRFDLGLEAEPNGIDAETLAPFDVLVVDYCGPLWLAVTEKAVEVFVRSGKGLDEIYYAPGEFCAKFHCEPGVKFNVLATACDDPRHRGTGSDEPVLMTVQYGQSRVFHTVLGRDLSALVEPDSVVTFVRGTEWAATGAVTLPIPAQARAAAPKPLGVLVITGGHGCNPSFDSAFDGYDDLAWNHSTSNEGAFRRDIRNRHDALVYYDSMDLSETDRKNLRDFVEAGKGLLWTRGREPGAPKMEPAKPR